MKSPAVQAGTDRVCPGRTNSGLAKASTPLRLHPFTLLAYKLPESKKWRNAPRRREPTVSRIPKGFCKSLSDNKILHSRSFCLFGPYFRIEVFRVEMRKILLRIRFRINLFLRHDPLMARWQGINTPVNKHSKSLFLPSYNCFGILFLHFFRLSDVLVMNGI